MRDSKTPGLKIWAALRSSLIVAAGVGALVSFPAVAAPWTVTPELQVRGNYTDNIGLAAPGLEQSQTVVDLSPGIKIHGEGARVKMDVDYSVQTLSYLGDSSHNTYNNQLAANAGLEAIENWMFIDATAQVSQQNVSAFGPQPVDNINLTGNRTQVSSYSVSPYIKGVIGPGVAYQLRFNAYGSDSAASQLPRSQSSEWLGSLQGGTPLSFLSWGLDFNQRRSDYAGSPSIETDAYHATLNFPVDPQLSLSVNAGEEKNNFLLGQQSSSSHGFGFSWMPSATTSLVGQRDQRPFGPGYSLAFKHRMPMSSLDVRLSRDYSSTPDVLFRGLGTTMYSMLYDATSATLTPAERNSMVTAYLQAAGLSPTMVPTLAYATNRIVIQKTLQVAYAIIGARNTLTFTALSSDSASADAGFTVADDFAKFSSVAQKGLNVNWNHQLSGRTSFNAAWGRLLLTGDGVGSADSRQNTLSMGLTTVLSPKSNASFGVRHVKLDGTTLGYRENAMFLSLSFLF